MSKEVKDAVENIKGVSFSHALKRYKQSTKSAMRWARTVSEMAFQHAVTDGSFTQLQQVYDATPKNYGRKEALKAWVFKYSPLQIAENGTWRKDKGEDAKAFNLEKALSEPFWECVPDPTQAFFGEDDIVKALETQINKFSNEKKFKPKTKDAKARLDACKVAVAAIRNQLVQDQAAANVA